ncbi:MAG: sensor histidine kinase [Pyrinomonadaceae bacterium]
MFSFFNDSAGGYGGGRHYRLVRLAFIWGVWTLVGFFFASQIYFYFAQTPKPVTFAKALAWQVTAVYLFAIFTPLVLWLARRYRLGRLNWSRNALVHALAGVAISAVWAAGHVIIDKWFVGSLSRLTPGSLANLTFANIDKELLVYWIIVLSSHAAAYYQRYREGELRASQAQLQALKMQLHPHFLFNALHSVSSLVYKDPEAADRMITRIGDFLRLTLDNGAAQEVELQKELEFLNCYLEIERIRFHDRLTTEIHVDPRALGCQVPNLILQPIVENAIRHGVAPRSAPGRVEISAARVGDALRLQVRDNGPGLSAAKSVGRSHNGGLGLANTRARLEHLYGSAYRFEMMNAPEGGLVVTLEIPTNNGGGADTLLRAPFSGGDYATALGK